MSIESGLYAHLAAISGSTASDRVYPIWIPADEDYPAITWQLLGAPREHTHDGAGRLLTARFSVTCWAQTYEAARALADQVRVATDGLTGTLGGEDLEHCLLADIADVPAEASVDLAERRVFGRSMDFDIAYIETDPSV